MPTLDEVARAAGVSRNTVSRALSGKTKELWPSTARRVERIRRIAAEMGYRPNSAARAMGRGRFGCAALLLSTVPGRSTLPDRLLDGIHDALAQRDMHLALAKLPDETLLSEDLAPKVLRELMVDGFLINYNREIPAEMTDLIEEQQVPAVWINCKRWADCVRPDDLGGGRAATEHLLALGHRRIAYVHYSPPGSPEHYSEVDRQAGYEAAMAEAGLEPRLLRPAECGERDGRLAWTRELLSRSDRPTGIVAYAYGALVNHAAAIAGLRVPEDVSVISFAHRPEEQLGRRATTMVVPAGAMGEAAVEMLTDKLAAPRVPLPSRALPVALVPGETTGPAPRAESSQSRKG